MFHLMDNYGASGITLLFLACCETIAVAWIYGNSNLRVGGGDSCWIKLFFNVLVATVPIGYSWLAPTRSDQKMWKHF